MYNSIKIISSFVRNLDKSNQLFWTAFYLFNLKKGQNLHV
jgi:hypothetical protein